MGREGRQRQQDRVGESPQGWEGNGPTGSKVYVDLWLALSKSPGKLAGFPEEDADQGTQGAGSQAEHSQAPR